MEQKLTLEEAENKYGLSEKQFFDHVEKGELNIYYKHPELRGPFQIETTGDVDSVLELKQDRETSFLNGFMPVDPDTKNLLLDFALYSTQRSKMHNYQNSCTVYIKDVYLLESEVKPLVDSHNKQTRDDLFPDMSGKNKVMSKLGRRGKQAQDLPKEKIYQRMVKIAERLWASGEELNHLEMLDELWHQYVSDEYGDHHSLKLSKESLKGRLKKHLVAVEKSYLIHKGRPKKKKP